MQADKTLDALSSRSAWFGPSLLPGKPSNSPFEAAFICPFVVLDPDYSGATIVVAPGQMPGDFLPSPTQIACLISKASTCAPEGVYTDDEGVAARRSAAWQHPQERQHYSSHA